MAELDHIDRQIIFHLSGDIAGDRTPYRSIAEKVGLDETDVLDRVERYKREGILRRVGAIVDHGRAGFAANGMVVWNVPESKLDELGGMMASFDEVTHCYARPRYPQWQWNLYTMVHGTSETACREIVERISRETGVTDYRILFSTRELKKTSMVYFAPENG